MILIQIKCIHRAIELPFPDTLYFQTEAHGSNLRIKAAILGIKAEDYANDRVVVDLDLLFSGSHQLADDFWEGHGKQIESWQVAPKLHIHLPLGPLRFDQAYPKGSARYINTVTQQPRSMRE
jgi:hypothetical protein